MITIYYKVTAENTFEDERMRGKEIRVFYVSVVRQR